MNLGYPFREKKMKNYKYIDIEVTIYNDKSYIYKFEKLVIITNIANPEKYLKNFTQLLNTSYSYYNS